MRRIQLLLGLALVGSACAVFDGPPRRCALNIDRFDPPRSPGDPMRVIASIDPQILTEEGWVLDTGWYELPEAEDCPADPGHSKARILDDQGAPVELAEVPELPRDVWGNWMTWTLVEPGSYQLIGVEEAPDNPLVEPIPFEVPLWTGLVDPSLLEGQAYDLDDYETWPIELGALIQEITVPLGVQFSDVTESTAVATVFAQLPDDASCLVLRVEGELDEQGWNWSTSEGLSNDAGDPVVEWMDIDIAWQGVEAGDVRANALVDTRHIDPYIWEEADVGETCRLSRAVGPGCEMCSDGREYCMTVRGRRGRLEPRDAVDVTSMPVCGFDAVDPIGPIEIPSIRCDMAPIDLGCTTVSRFFGPSLLLAFLVVVGRRRES